jgi:hypothetical protein
MQVSVTGFDVREKRREWNKSIKPDMVEHLVFLDESGVNTDLTRLYGRAPSSQRVVDHTPLNTPQTTAILSSIRLDGEKAFTTYQGGTTGGMFCLIFEGDFTSNSLVRRHRCDGPYALSPCISRPGNSGIERYRTAVSSTL